MADADGVDALAALDQILRDCRHIADLDLVVVTGDIADGEDAGLLLPGLADERAALSMIGGLRVITLDSLIPGSGHGIVSDAQLSALRDLLRDPAPAGTIVALHHPPIHTPTAPWMIEAGLRNRDAPAAVLAGTDVAAVLCGHFHLQLTGRLGGTTVWATPGVVTRIDLSAPPHVVRGVSGASATVVDLGGSFSPSFHVICTRDPQAGREVYVVDPATWQPVAED